MQSATTKNPSLESLLTVTDVAAILNRSARYVRDYAREMGVSRIGGGHRRAGRLRFTREGVSQFAERDFRPRVSAKSTRSEMQSKNKSPREIKPAPPCRCECKACDLGIHCGNKNSGCEHPPYKTMRRTH
jgi:hypothetical protein